MLKGVSKELPHAWLSGGSLGCSHERGKITVEAAECSVEALPASIRLLVIRVCSSVTPLPASGHALHDEVDVRLNSSCTGRLE